MKNLNNRIRELATSLKESGWSLKSESEITCLNVTYLLLKNGALGKDPTAEEIRNDYDNLYFNCEFLDADNYNDYDLEKIAKEHRKTIKTIKKELENKNFYLLSYYSNNKFYKSFLKLDSNYDIVSKIIAD